MILLNDGMHNINLCKVHINIQDIDVLKLKRIRLRFKTKQ